MKDFLTRQATGSASSDPGTPYISTFEQKPTIQIRETTSDIYVDDVIRVVQLINAALPYDKRISVSPERAVHPSGDEHDYQTHYIPAGHIYVGLGSQSTWPPEEIPPVTVAGVEFSLGSADGGPASYIWINTNLVRRGNQARTVLAHEIFHALGFYAHIRGYRTVMNTGNYVGFPITYLPQIDTDALYALYTHFTDEYGFRPFDANDLGPWTDISFHLRGDIEDVSFGTSSRNGLIQPWAHGPSPPTSLSGLGSASWSGRLLGFTFDSESLAGAAGFTIDLATLTGQLDFSGLEHWGVNAAPGPIGSGTMWNDGDLRYNVVVQGNTFMQAGGDAGEVTGAFFGTQHEGMGGVVERSDMSAGFGGTRFH